MKVSKSKFASGINEQLARLGYHYLDDNITVANILYGKVIDKDLYLTLGITISNYYEGKFTGAFYLSKSTVWGALWGDIPKKSYQRIGVFLTEDERDTLLTTEYQRLGVVDAWWDHTIDGVSKFLEAVIIAEDRFRKQIDLISEIQKSSAVNKLAHLSRFLKEQVTSITSDDNFAYRFIPRTEIDGIPLPWFKAAEKILIQEKSLLNSNTVKRLAADAWRQNYLANLKSV